MLSVVAIAAATAHWRALLAVPQRQHVLLGGLLALLLLWLLTFRVIDGVWMHLLGVTSLTLIVGWRFAVIGGAVVMAVYLRLQGRDLAALPLAMLFSVFIPASSTRLLGYVLRRYGMKNLFVYQLGAGFGGGLLSVLVLGIVSLPVFWVIGQGGWVDLALENWPFILLVMFPEGFINGMLITAFTTFFPDVVKTFDDGFYLDGRS